MLLVIDIGNSNVTIGCYEEDKLSFTARCSTDINKTGDQYAVDLYNILQLYKCDSDKIQDCIICSVVPTVNNALIHAVKMIIGKAPICVGPGIKTGLNIVIDNPAQLGADLVAGAVGAVDKYPLPCIILDLGTATTIFAVDKKGNFLGGAICAGVNLTLDALSSRTSMLPKISIDAPKSPIGTNTVDSMKSGLIFGTSAMIDGMISRFENTIGEECSVVATGGLSKTIIEHCEKDIVIDETLLLDGLKKIYRLNK